MSNRALKIVYDAIDDVNAMGAGDVVIQKTPDTLLLSSDGGVDSLSFVNLIVSIEQKIADETGMPIVLVTEETMSLEESPFYDVKCLSTYIGRFLS